MGKKTIAKIVVVCLPMMLAACGSKKAVVDNTVQPHTTTVPSTEATTGVAFVQRVAENQVSAKNIVGDMSFNIKMGEKDVTVPGSVHMRKDEVIRLQLFIPLLGSEVGRLEFTPNEVLVVDRMHKEYVQADYNQLSFLKNNGLTFYTLQALFWNELLVPGSSSVKSKDYPSFEVGTDQGNDSKPLSMKKGNISYRWLAAKESGLITNATVSYQSSSHGASDLVWDYGNFTPVGTKQFPALQNIKFTTTSSNKLKKVEVNIKMKEVKTTEKWDVKTTVSNKYKKVEANDILGKLLKM
ncbi:MAG: DUF4292 domain-containing protein [Prevotella sp.]|nr:DUF4292 domain-containing protein [Prevotella sp.]